MLWDIIRDWFVQYIFGGKLSSGSVVSARVFGDTTTSSAVFPITDGLTISMGDWLSTTSTIITLVLLVVMLLSMVRFIVRQVSGLFAKI